MKKTYILALAALAMAFSCQKAENSPEPASEPVVRTFTCTIADAIDPETRVAISQTDGKTTWEVGDEILFHGKYAGGEYSTVVTLTSSDISANGKSFTVTVPDFTNGADQAKWASSSANYSASNIFALYPASAATMVDSGSTNWYNKNFFGETNHPLMSGFNDGYDSNSFTFYNLCGILSFIVTEDYDSYVLSGNNDETVSYTKYTSRLYKKTDDTINTDWVYTEAGKDYSTAVKTISGSVNNGTETRIFIPAGVTFTGGFTIHFIKSGSIVKQLSTTKAVSVPRNSYRPMGDVTTYLEDYSAPSGHDSSIDMTGATELDASGNANCYILSGGVAANKGKVFTFKAYKGNSTTGVGTIDSVDILWETWNNDEDVTAGSIIDDIDYDKQDANEYYTIVFHTPSSMHAGNALIAAKDASDKILWSWHIWVPATAITTNTYGFGSAAMMSRNLGALVDANGTASSQPDITSVGLMYQWGRKDPFMGAGSFYTVTGANGAKTSPADAFTTSGSANVTLAHTIQNPTEFAKGSNDSDTWCSESTVAFWGDDKTIYDPCPVGYKVPKSSEVTLLNKKSSEITGWNACTAYNWFEAGDPATQFANAGFIEETGLGNYRSPERLIIWSSTAYSDGIRGRCALYSGGSASSSSKQAQARGGAVRCIVE